MKAIKVKYTVKDDYAETNKGNIQKVIEELKTVNAGEIMYSSWIKEDGKTFVHLFLARRMQQIHCRDWIHLSSFRLN